MRIFIIYIYLLNWFIYFLCYVYLYYIEFNNEVKFKILFGKIDIFIMEFIWGFMINDLFVEYVLLMI